MAARLKKFHQEEVRTKIKTSQLIKRVQDYALGILDDDDISTTRLRAIEVLLRKTLPDQTAVSVSGDAENPIVNKVMYEIVDNSDSD